MANGGDQDPFELARKLSESFREVKFGRGIVGKTAYLTAAIIGLWAIVLFRLSGDWWLNLALIAVGLLGTGIYGWWVTRTHKFAKENPAIALLEGAQLIEYQRFEAQAKGMLNAPRAPVIQEPKQIPGDGA